MKYVMLVVFVCLGCVTTTLAQTLPAGAPPAPSTQPVTLSRDVIDAFAGQLVEKEYVHGLAVAIVNPDGTNQIIGYGVDGAGKPIDGDTVFEIGSVSKVFTSLLVAQMAATDELALDDPIQKHLPPGTKLAQALIDHPITLLGLATHHSGLPRMPDNFKPASSDNPYVDYTDDLLYAFLAAVVPSERSGDGVYSNVGVGLLGHIASLVGRAPYEQLLVERIAKPLGMTSTSVKLDDAARAKLARGHDADGNDAPNWDFAGAFVGAGGIRSTANDMARFVGAQIDPANRAPQLAKAVALTHEKRATMSAGTDIGLGWMIDTQRRTYWHNGQTGGYHSYVAFSPEAKCGVVLLGDTATTAIDGAGARLVLRMLGNEKVGPPLLRTPAKISNAAIDRLVGEYGMAVGKMTITRDGEKVFAQLTGQPKVRVYPQSEDVLFWKVVEASLKFDLPEDASAKATKLTLTQNGRNIPGKRIDESPTSKPN